MDFTATAPGYRGALTEHLVHPANLDFRLPDELSLDEGALVEPASVATHAVEMAGSLPGRTVVVLGSGAAGLMVPVVARMAGARCVVAVDLQQRRLDKALRLGAGAAVNAREADVAGRIRQIVGRYGADVVFGTAGAGRPGPRDRPVRAGRAVDAGVRRAHRVSPPRRGGASGGGESSSSLLSTSADGTMLLARQDSEKLEMCAIFLAVLLSRTKAPLPCRLISRPCWQSSSMARRIVIRLTP